ncbi:hypothetical protein Ct9H90mP29_02450 [bacterium]|nr:MAG: hypothetical protein Ct9H90mP29_02450 [bacterium]
MHLKSGIVLRGKGSALALRKPQLAQAKATLEAARANLERARRDLDRATFIAPFDGRVPLKKYRYWFNCIPRQYAWEYLFYR